MAAPARARPSSTESTASACAPLPLCCTFVAEGSSTSYHIRVSPEFCSTYRSFVGLDPAQPPETWGRHLGLELQWEAPKEPLCRTQSDCEDGANATCVDDPLTPAARCCFCMPGLTWSPIVDACQQRQPWRREVGDDEWGPLVSEC